MSKRARKRTKSFLCGDNALHPMVWQLVLERLCCELDVALSLISVAHAMSTLAARWLRRYFAGVGDEKNIKYSFQRTRQELTEMSPRTPLLSVFARFAAVDDFQGYDAAQWTRLLSMLALARAHFRLCRPGAVRKPISDDDGTFRGDEPLHMLFYITPCGSFAPLSALPGLRAVSVPADADAVVFQSVNKASPSPEAYANVNTWELKRTHYKATNWIPYNALRFDVLQRAGLLEPRELAGARLDELVWKDRPLVSSELELFQYRGIVQSSAQMLQGLALHFYTARNADMLCEFFAINEPSKLDDWMRRVNL